MNTRVLGDFGYKCPTIRPTKDRGHDPININKFNRQKQNNAIVESAVDKILLQEKNKVIAKEKSYENIGSDFYENELYHIYNIIPDDKKERLE